MGREQRDPVMSPANRQLKFLVVNCNKKSLNERHKISAFSIIPSFYIIPPSVIAWKRPSNHSVMTWPHCWLQARLGHICDRAHQTDHLLHDNKWWKAISVHEMLCGRLLTTAYRLAALISHFPHSSGGSPHVWMTEQISPAPEIASCDVDDCAYCYLVSARCNCYNVYFIFIMAIHLLWPLRKTR